MMRTKFYERSPPRSADLDELAAAVQGLAGVPEPQSRSQAKAPIIDTGLQPSHDTLQCISSPRSFRKIQLVWEELHSLGSLTILLHSASHGAARTRSPSCLSRTPWFKPYIDKDGPYIIDALPKIAHWALRVEKEPGKGRWQDDTSWQYFSLRQTGGTCYLDMKSFICPDGRDKLWDSVTEFDIRDVEACAQHLITEAGKYNLLGNNCQTFAGNLLTIIMSIACPQHTLAQMLLNRNLITEQRISDLHVARNFAVGTWNETYRTSKGRLVFGTTLEINTLAECLRSIFRKIGRVNIPEFPSLNTDRLETIRNARKAVTFDVSAEDLNKTVHQDIE